MSEWTPAQPYPPQPYGQQPQGAGLPPYAPDLDRRPGTVTAAAVLTWVGSAIAAVGAMIGIAVVAGPDSVFVDEFVRGSEGQFTREQAQGIMTALCVVIVVWSLVATVLGVFVVRRHPWARVVLTISAVVAALLSLLCILSIVAVVPLLAAGATTVLLYVGGANAWFVRRSSSGSPYGPYYGPYYDPRYGQQQYGQPYGQQQPGPYPGPDVPPGPTGYSA